MLQPPPTPFYTDPSNVALWRELVYLSSENPVTFARVLADFQLAREPYPCGRCQTPVVNIAGLGEVELQCPNCNWQPVTVEGNE